MFGQIKGLVLIGAASVFLLGCKSEQTADLGQVLDRSEFALNNYQEHLEGTGVSQVADEEMAEFIDYYTKVLNAEPRFYAETLGINIQDDASFLGFVDPNSSGIQEEGEGKLFTVEVDEANNRLIATDVAGNSSGLRFSGSGFLTGMLIGNLIGRQRSAGIGASSFNNRTVTPRSSYRAPSSARAGGPRSGK